VNDGNEEMADGIGDDFFCFDRCHYRGLWLVTESMGVNRIAALNKEMSNP
jgi:hypothetical protein